jgi:GAF domain-containing protein
VASWPRGRFGGPPSLSADELAALRRVATLVARQPAPAEVFAAVTEEAGKLLHLDSAHLVVYESDATARVVGAWNLRGPPAPIATRVPLDGDNIVVRVFRTHRPVRIDEYSDASGPIAGYARSIGIRAAVGAPVLVGGRAPVRTPPGSSVSARRSAFPSSSTAGLGAR